MFTPRYQHLLSFYLLLLFAAAASTSYAQDSREFKFSGTVTDRTDDKAIQDFMVDVYRGNKVVSTVVGEKKGRFDFVLGGSGEYTIEIMKAGYYPKRAIIITDVPEDIKKLPTFKFEMELIRMDEYEALEELDPFATSIFDFPYVIFEYDKSAEDLNYRKDYTRHIKDQYEAVDELR